MCKHTLLNQYLERRFEESTIIASEFAASWETAVLSLYVPYQMENLHSSLFSQVGVHILCLFFKLCWEFSINGLEKREEGGSL